MPKISVLTPLYKTHDDVLRETIESVLGQTYGDFELLLLDDSPPGERKQAVVEEYKDERIRYEVNETNLGISDSRNKLMKLARGEYFAVLDHDDVMLPTRLEKQVAYMDEHPEVGVLGSYVEWMKKHSINRQPTDHQSISLRLMTSCCVVHTATMLRRSVIEQTGAQYEKRWSPAEDYALWLFLLSHTQFHNLPEALTRYRCHENNTSKLQKSKMDICTAGLLALAETRNPLLYKQYLNSTPHVILVRIFGFIPLIRAVGRRNRDTVRWVVWLFNFIPILIIKKRIRQHQGW